MKTFTFLFAAALATSVIAAPMTKTDNGDGTVTYEQGGPNGGYRETVQEHQAREIERKAKEDGMKVKDITPR